MDCWQEDKKKRSVSVGKFLDFEVLFSNTEPLFQPCDLTLDTKSIWKTEVLSARPQPHMLVKRSKWKGIRCEDPQSSGFQTSNHKFLVRPDHASDRRTKWITRQTRAMCRQPKMLLHENMGPVLSKLSASQKRLKSKLFMPSPPIFKCWPGTQWAGLLPN